MSTSTSACYDFAAHTPKRPARKTAPHAVFGSAVVASLMLGCAWTVYANVFGASVYPSLSSSDFDLPVVKRSPVVAERSPATIINNVFAALPEPAPVISAPATASPAPSFSFDDRFAASGPQSQASQSQVPAPQRVETPPPVQAPQLAQAAKPPEAPKLAAVSKPQDAPKPQVVAALPPDRQVVISPPVPAARPADAKPPAKSAGASVRDMAQRAKAAVMSIASNEKQSIVEKLWGKPPPSRGPSLLSFASADASFTGSLGPAQNPALAGNTPRYDQSTAVYDITAHMVYLPDGSKLEAHSGLGSRLDDPRFVRERMYGATPPHLYDLEPREALFHGVAALRLKPVGGEEAIFGRTGLLAHTYMLGPNGDSNGCVSFRDYDAFLKAYKYGGIKRLAVVEKVD